jgi:hypothetical protein
MADEMASFRSNFNRDLLLTFEKRPQLYTYFSYLCSVKRFSSKAHRFGLRAAPRQPKYSRLTALLIEATKEQQKMIKKQQPQISSAADANEGSAGADRTALFGATNAQICTGIYLIQGNTRS